MLAEPKNIDLLLVDDDAEFRDTVARRFLRSGYRVQEAADGIEGLELTARRQFDVAVVDLRMPGLSGVELLDKLKAAGAECEVVLLTGEGSIETAVDAMKRGAHDYLTKPFPLGELEVVVQRACAQRQLRKENQQLKAVLERSRPNLELIGRSAAMKEVFHLIERVGPTDKAILIQGESGTGIELVARALHRASPRAERPMVVINCAALPEALLESELFGHEKGSFTGAVNAKPGLFEVADGGTLFIDEIGEMPGPLQAKLLRVLEDGSMRRIGSLKELRVDVRLLAATNRLRRAGCRGRRGHPRRRPGVPGDADRRRTEPGPQRPLRQIAGLHGIAAPDPRLGAHERQSIAGGEAAEHLAQQPAEEAAPTSLHHHPYGRYRSAACEGGCHPTGLDLAPENR